MAGKKLSKEEEGLLRAYANCLPAVLQNSHEVHILTGAEIIENGEVENEGKKIIPDKKYLYNMPVQVANNHYRRLKRAWLKDGEKGLTVYLKYIAELAEKNKEQNAKS